MRKHAFLLKKVTRRLGLWKPASSGLTVLSDDVFLVAFPKSGITWLRFLLAQARLGTKLDFSSIEKYVPDIYQNSDRECKKVIRPRILKSHEMYKSEYPCVIYLIRDPRDVAISLFHWRKRNGSLATLGLPRNLEGYLSFGFEKIDAPFGGWKSHVSSWINNSNFSKQKLFILKYEDLKNNTESMMEEITEFLGWNLSKKQLKFAIELSSMERMREAEKVDLLYNFPRFFLKIFGKESIPFVRSAKSGNWINHMNKNQEETFMSQFGDLPTQLGYKVR